MPADQHGQQPWEWPEAEWRRIVGRLKRIESMASRLSALERASGIRTAEEDDNERSQGESDD